MGEAAPRQLAETTLAPRRRSVSSAPEDWFVDPVDPRAAERHARSGQSLEDQATALLLEHASTVEDAPRATVVDLLEAPAGETDPWGAVAELYSVEEDEGELAWQTDALCAQTDPEAFFPEKGGSTRDAKRVCEACPVQSACLDYAMSKDEKFGIWGGLSERERRRLRRLGR
ncbi:WhiB family transcriptional regulator [Kocuria flava]|uniref:WhiB family transcriptional regulator n=1 Tax=Kocuria flava TaxID=446860 RepID=UPI0024853671|nr:WhiB family transcriptional regulator [Kocuria flava]